MKRLLTCVREIQFAKVAAGTTGGGLLELENLFFFRF